MNKPNPQDRNSNRHIYADGEQVEVLAFTNESAIVQGKEGTKLVPYSKIDLTKVAGSKLRKQLHVMQSSLSEHAPVAE